MSPIPARCLWSDASEFETTSAFRDERATLDLDGLECDIVIIGAGFTGLWTALYLLRADPSLDVVIVEAEHIGFGASGRNGGWCSPLLPMSLGHIARTHGRDTAIATRQAMVDTVEEVGRRIDEYAWDCDFTVGGSLELLRNDAQRARGRAHVEDMRSLAVPESEVRIVTDSDLTDLMSARNAPEAVLETRSAVLHPGRLVRHLAEQVRSLGAQIVEGVAAISIDPGCLLTERGEIRATRIIRATEAFTPRMRTHRRTVLPLYSLMIATEPLSAETWAEIGLLSRTTFTDGRRMLIYGQRTRDDRIAFGGRGAPYHFGSRIRPAFDTNATVARHLTASLHELLPPTRRARITHHWGGPLAAPRDWTCSVQFDPRTGLAAAGGYVGDGVATSNLAGRTLADLILSRSSDIVRLPWVQHTSRSWEPEPIRWIAVNGLARLAAYADRRESRTGREARLIGSVIRRISGD